MRKKYRSKKTSNKIIILLVAILFVSLGYALYSQQLEINGNISGSARFKVYFAEAWIKHSSSEEDHTDTPNGKDEAEIASGTVNINTSAGADKVQFNVTLNCPGDKVLIGTRIKNESTISVKLNDFKIKRNANNPDIKLNYISLYRNTEILKKNEICDYEFVVEWDENSENTTQTPVQFEITLDYEQYTENPILEASHSHEEEESPEFQEYKIDIVGNDEISDNYTIYVGEERKFKAVVKSVYTDGTEKNESDKTINWTVTYGTGNVNYQANGDILTIIGNREGDVYLRAECVIDGATITETKEMGVIEWSVIDETQGLISNGINTLKIGQYVDYDNTKNVDGETVTASYISTKEKNGAGNASFVAYKYTAGWRILGISDGRLQLISATTVGTLPLTGASGYLNGEDELNSICSIYGNGKNADYAKCINANDINEITGYSPKVTGNGEVRAKGKLWEYGNLVTFKWLTNSKLVAYGQNNTSETVAKLPFTYYDEEQKKFTTLPVGQTFTIISDSYNYYPTTLTESSSGPLKGITTTSPQYNLLFKIKYWLASRFSGSSSTLQYGFFAINSYRVYEAELVASRPGETNKSFSAGVRPVVTLSAYTRIKANYSSGNGDTLAKAWGIE